MKVCQVNISLNFSRKPIGPEDLLNRIVEALSITIDRCPKEKPKKKADK